MLFRSSLLCLLGPYTRLKLLVCLPACEMKLYIPSLTSHLQSL
jgi:hypothetical protein